MAEISEKSAGPVPPKHDHVTSADAPGADDASTPPSKTEEATGPYVVDKETERRLLRKLDIRIIPTVMWIYLMNMMDRVNIGNGRLFGFEEDLNLKGDQFQLAVSVLFVTYCLFEAPSNMIIKRLQPARYLAGLTLAWGLIATFSCFVQNFAALIACRLLLGLFEAGLFPGVILYLTMFYGKRSIALRMAYFFATSAFSGVAGGLVAYGISFLDNVGGWRAWRWIILINGLPTIVTGLLVPFILPNSPETARFLSEEDRRILVRMQEAEVGTARNARELDWADVREGMRDWTVYVFSIALYCLNTMLYSFAVFLPTIVHGLGTWSRTEVQALTVPVYFAGAVVYLINARLSDYFQRRSYFILGGTSVSILGYCLLLANKSVGLSYAGCFFISMGCYTAGGMSLVWLATNNPRYGKRAMASGIHLTFGNASGVAAPFLYQTKYAPTFYPGYGATVGVLVLSMVLNLVLLYHFNRENKERREGKQDWKIEGKTEAEIEEMGEKSPRFIYTI
ncbi:major facilitator superfamily domain-containing protein [Plectosphaerella plurivora]|uniref:Major facilitator superfamily domain-containing protein n=1 Tax=Plectosphaerella plurivora TaxID=936078 RepID=A0A9P9AEI1_9PEZI|nr:major facilitator superfamily domain-containing protein [Plectosphaerella plurivora]